MKPSPITRRFRFGPRQNWQLVFQYLFGFLLLLAVGLASTTHLKKTDWFGDRRISDHWKDWLPDYFERKSHDLFHVFEWHDENHPDYPLEDFFIIYIDDISHKELDQPWDRPWDRRLHAALLNKIRQDQPKLVFYDMIFDMPSSEPESDEIFAHEIEAAGNVILGASNQQYYHPVNAQPAEQLFVPYAPFRRAAADWGVIEKRHDHGDNGLRRMQKTYEDTRFDPAFWIAAEFLAPDIIARTGSVDQSRLIRYVGPSGTIPHTSFYLALLDENIDFSDKYIFVGGRHSVAMPGAGRDVYRSPYLRDKAGELTGVELQTMMVRNLLTESWMHEPENRHNWIMVTICALILTIMVNPFGPRWGFAMAALFALGFSIYAIHWIESEKVFVAWLVPVVVQAPVAFIFSGACNYYFLERKRHRLKRIFSTYLSPIMVEQIADAEEEPQLGGEMANITPFFSDVVSYSKFSELLSPVELMQLMNEYLGAMTNVIQEERGTLDKYIGDAIVAIYGAPLHTPDHAYRACRSAVRIQQEQRRLCRKWAVEKAHWPELVQKMQTRIGLNTGDAVVGNMGSHVRFNYSMTGDAVNLAARCESGAKHFGVYTMVTQSTYEAATRQSDHGLVFRRLNRCTVVGREEPVDLYELMGFRDELSASLLECRDLYEAALKAFAAQKWDEAQTLLDQSAALEAHQPGRDWGVNTNPSLLLNELCQSFSQDPPPLDWGGVYNLTSK